MLGHMEKMSAPPSLVGWCVKRDWKPDWVLLISACRQIIGNPTAAHSSPIRMFHSCDFLDGSTAITAAEWNCCRRFLRRETGAVAATMLCRAARRKHRTVDRF